MRSLNVGLISVGPGNVMNLYRGIMRAAESIELKMKLKLVDKPLEKKKSRFDILFLPGVGHFGEGMRRLRESDLDKFVLEYNEDGGILVGVCLGAQLLFSKSAEAPGISGLGLLSGEIVKLKSQRLPHMGWNTVDFKDDVFEELSGEFFYFVHSYRISCDSDIVLGLTEYCDEEFPSAVKRENVLGFQFHPEKSHLAGLKLLGRLLKWSLSQL